MQGQRNPWCAAMIAGATLLGTSTMIAQQAGPAPETAPMNSMILSQMHHVNQMEIKAGKLAAQKGTTQQIREYGERLVKDHTMADGKVMAFAKSHNIPVHELAQPGEAADMSGMSPGQQQMQRQQQMMSAMRMLPDLQGSGFDKQFLDLMQHGHEMAISMLQSAHDKLPSNSPLRSFIGRMTPVLTQHYTIASRLDLKVTAGMMH